MSRKRRGPASAPGDYALARGGAAGPLFQPPPPRIAPVEEPRCVTVIPSGRDSGSLIGLTEADAALIKELSVRTGPSTIWRLIAGARAAGYAVLIRSDLPPID